MSASDKSSQVDLVLYRSTRANAHWAHLNDYEDLQSSRNSYAAVMQQILWKQNLSSGLIETLDRIRIAR